MPLDSPGRVALMPLQEIEGVVLVEGGVSPLCVEITVFKCANIFFTEIRGKAHMVTSQCSAEKAGVKCRVLGAYGVRNRKE